MNYNFKNVVIYQFLSFGYAEIDLQDKGYCLIRGVNTNADDRATSNGAGKSTIANAICWALTGQTLNGLKTCVENIHTEGGCYVKLTMSVDKDEYEITRYKNHSQFKTDLKIIKNGEDISGKGIRESEDILAQHIPFLNSQLISSVILLGQNLPSSFTKNTPSGRKELLEVLTNSDSMIVDVKNRIDTRLKNLTSNKRLKEDSILELSTRENLLEGSLSRLKERLEQYKTEGTIEDINLNLVKQKGILEKAQVDLDAATHAVDTLTKVKEETEKKIHELMLNEKEAVASVESNYSSIKEQINLAIQSSTTSQQHLLTELTRIRNIKDICPTCGQKLQGVVKPDTTEIENNLNSISEDLKTNRSKLSEVMLESANAVTEVRNQYKKELLELNDGLEDLNQDILSHQVDVSRLTQNISIYTQLIADIEAELKYRENNIADLKTNIGETEKELAEIKEKLTKERELLSDVQSHLDVVNKINTIVKRDFRGYLLLDIIKFLDKQAKSYCQYVFNCDNLSIEINGNNIDISFCGKPFDNLSGGEKKKVDCIIQFAIRALLSNYFNFTSNILFLDELFDELDYSGCDGLINLITNTLVDIESVFIISHHCDELDIPTDNEIVVVKNSEGISEVH